MNFFYIKMGKAVNMDREIEQAFESSEPLPKEFWQQYSLANIFGDTSSSRILQFLLVHRDWDYTLKEIARQTHVGYRTFYRFIPKLIELDVIKVSRRVGAAKLYNLNLDSEIVKHLDKLAILTAAKQAKNRMTIKKVTNLKDIQKKMAGRLPQWSKLEGKADKILEREMKT